MNTAYNLYGNLVTDSGIGSFSIIMPISYWIGALIYVFILLFMLFSKLTVIITDREINIRHLLFFKKSFAVSDVVTSKIVAYYFLGYGIRMSPKYGTVYNVKGNKGLAITLKKGKKILIGTQKPTALLLVMEQILD
ncbi:hypothetical protein BFP77_10000 [Maribacter sp. 4U21]|uniref:hypothetical protein n=1 Tax=Maribacter sp. 4U21 TaxID=1889779 RepID=UPI000C1591E4|nr:hypothetical protein [Maribacter sp. 4U21]PIB28303.1 hypothetical protein BFP77_10000 [Maribacter sp. 4U21]